MIGMNTNEFMDKIYYGNEIEFKIGGITYFVQGSQNNGKYYLTVDYWTTTDGSEPQHDYLLSIECDSADERLKQFEEAKIFGGKNIYEIDSSVEVEFG